MLHMAGLFAQRQSSDPLAWAVAVSGEVMAENEEGDE